jgi:hypothetical protein
MKIVYDIFLSCFKVMSVKKSHLEYEMAQVAVLILQADADFVRIT